MKKHYLFFLLLSISSVGQISQVKDIFLGNTTVAPIVPNSGNPTNLFNYNGTLLFRAIDATANGIELWKSDGTPAGTVQVKDINISNAVR